MNCNIYIHRNLASHQPRHHTGRRDAKNHHSPLPPLNPPISLGHYMNSYMKYRPS